MAFEVNYSGLDRLLHRIAFATPSMQRALADLERSLYGDSYDSVTVDQPVFITSLPRAGTTLLLEIFARLPTVATHTYRDMPFVTAPILWSRLNQPFRKQQSLKARAHGDGMQIGYDSPEAFEEIFWRLCWPHKFKDDGISLWNASDVDAESRSFLLDHMKKIVSLRCPERLDAGRYVSKNNGNIARLESIPKMFDGALLLVPFRDPFQHAVSLHRQHLNFVKMHQTEPFVRRYMEDLGHLEFGELHRPIRFPGIDALLAGKSPMTIDYWLSYWIAAFEYIYQQRRDLHLVSYEEICAGGRLALQELCDRLNLEPDESLAGSADGLHSPSAVDAGSATADTLLARRAKELHRELMASQ